MRAQSQCGLHTLTDVSLLSTQVNSGYLQQSSSVCTSAALWVAFVPTSVKEVMFSSVCWFKDYAESTELMCTKLCGGRGTDW